VSDHPPDIILVHDAARPFASEALIARSIESAYLKGAAIPGISVIDTIKKTDLSGIITSTPPRRDLRAVQTPQAFKFDILLKAHRSALSAKDIEFTDDASIAEWAGHKVHIFEGEPENIKVTTPEDVNEARQRLSGPRDVRTGIGYDVHAFEEGDHVILGGVRIPFTKKLKGHSDADVGLHALTDAIFGALAEGDIGSHFPPSDMTWKNADSALFLRHAVERVKARGGVIKHLDLTLICEAPKIGPHRDAIRARIAELCGIKITRVGVKATTTEQLGFTGRGEGIAAQAIATIELPDLA
jgi:2-C-methyl-D-erythritol 4-phosphate cytidylyltransferase/2-C-methyl-D-erythritol 2,4-cyclodiphosphate synthase